ncbi:MAG TPA: helix-turn-helix domain-containing protein [Bacteroidales bacterium]|nr:helix-turn-helix domain-containing protein [Bacteroidales bacterium]
MHFQYIKPTGILSHFIRHYWVLEADASEGEVCERIIPTGNIELMFHYGDPFVVNKYSQEEREQPRTFVSGISSNYADIYTQGTCGLITVTFLPLGACNFFRFPLNHIEDTIVDMDDLYKESFKFIEEQISAAATTIERIAIMENFLLQQFQPVYKRDLSTIQKGVLLVNESKGQITAKNLADKLALSPKTLERKFSTLLGKTPKQFLRIVRFQEVIRRFSQKDYSPLTDYAYTSGYFDQAHFVKDFKALSGYTPKEFLFKCPSCSDYFF